MAGTSDRRGAGAGAPAASDELRRAHQRFEELYHLAPVGYLALSPDGTVEDVNLAGAALLGLERSAVPGRRLADLLEPADVERWNTLLATMVRPGDRVATRIAFRRGDGTPLAAQLACTRARPAGGRPVLHAVLEDRTELAAAERECRELREDLALVLGELDGGFWDWTPARRSMVVGGALRPLLGGGVDGAVVRCAPRHPAWLESVHPDDRGRVAERIADLLQGRAESLELQVRWSTPGGEERWMRLRGRVIRRDAQGRALRIAGSLSDETDPRRLRVAALRVEEVAALREAALRSLPGAAVGIFDESRRVSLVEGDASSRDGEGQTLAARLVLQGFAPAAQARLDAAFTRALAGQASRLEVRHAGRRLEIRTGPLRGAAGTTPRGVVVILDLSGRPTRRGQALPP